MFWALVCVSLGGGFAPPETYGPIPSPAQVNYHESGMAAFIRFGLRTFSSDASKASDFNPSALATDEWVLSLKSAGFTRIILSAKSRDGFCLWKTQTTDFSVLNSPSFQKAAQQLGQSGDVVEEFSKACTKHEVKMGIAISPWDTHAPEFGTGSDYNELYKRQLEELLSNPKYGNDGRFSEIWIDGDRPSATTQTYAFKDWFALVKRLQPGALVASPYGSHVRPLQEANDPCWSKINVERQMKYYDENGHVEWRYMNSGDESGDRWSTGEMVVNIGPEEFWSEGGTLISVEELVDAFFGSVAHGQALVLNVPPSREGILEQNVVDRLTEFGRELRTTFSVNLAEKGTASACSVRGDHELFGAHNVLTDDQGLYWTMNDEETTGWIEIDLGAPTVFDIIMIKEHVLLGQRIKKFVCQVCVNGYWKIFQSGQTIGPRRILRTAPVTADKVRLLISKSLATPVIQFIGVYRASPAFSMEGRFPEGLTRIDTSNLALSGEWTAVGDALVAGQSELSAAYQFEGTKIWLLGTKAEDAVLRVEIDDTVVPTCAAAGKMFGNEKVLCMSQDLGNGQHVMKVDCVAPKFEITGMYVLENKGIGMVEFETADYCVTEGDSVMMKIVRIGGASKTVSFTMQTVPESAVPDVNYVPERIQVTMEEGERVRVVTIRTLKNAQGKQGMKLYAELLDPIGGVILGFQRRAEIVIKQSESFDGLSISRAQQIVGKSLIWVSLIVGFGLTVFAVVYTVNTNRRKTADELAFLVVHQSPPAQSEEPVAPTV